MGLCEIENDRIGCFLMYLSWANKDHTKKIDVGFFGFIN